MRRDRLDRYDKKIYLARTGAASNRQTTQASQWQTQNTPVRQTNLPDEIKLAFDLESGLVGEVKFMVMWWQVLPS
jgi:hypothetical protein